MKAKLTAVVLSFILLLSFASCSLSQNTEKTADAPVYDHIDGTLSVHFIDVGQGDSTFIQFPNGQTMLIDAGESDAGEIVVSYLQALGVSLIDFVVATHPHSDHIGGLPAVFDAFDIEKIFMPNAVSNSYIFEALLDKIETEGCETAEAAAGITVVSDSAYSLNACFIAPVSDEYENLNNYSAVLRLEYKEKSFLFTGDAESLAEKEILENGVSAVDVLKVGHHGSKTSSSSAFVKALSPQYAVMQVGKDNSYGHPHAEILERYNSFDSQILRTDEMGTIIISSDGYKLAVLNSEAFTENDVTSDAPEEKQAVESTYILNTNSKKIHTEDCASAVKISDKNKKITNESIESLEAQGYTCCKSCNPG